MRSRPLNQQHGQQHPRHHPQDNMDIKMADLKPFFQDDAGGGGGDGMGDIDGKGGHAPLLDDAGAIAVGRATERAICNHTPRSRRGLDWGRGLLELGNRRKG